MCKFLSGFQTLAVFYRCILKARPAALRAPQAKDTFGNNRLQGGDDVSVQAVLSTSSLVYRGAVVDNEDGTYMAVYTIPRAG